MARAQLKEIDLPVFGMSETTPELPDSVATCGSGTVTYLTLDERSSVDMRFSVR
jgi:hypothetical protein